MAIDFFDISDRSRSNRLFRLSEKTLEKIKAAADVLESKSGIFIDPYGKTILHPNHVKLLLDCINSSKDKPAKDLDVDGFKKFLEERSKGAAGALALEGD